MLDTNNKTSFVIGWIPARAGSRGVPHKNMTLVRGKPLIQYTIDTALECASLDQIVVLSDDPEVDHLVENRYPNNARIVFMREPACIAQDYSTDYQACLYTLITL